MSRDSRKRRSPVRKEGDRQLKNNTKMVGMIGDRKVSLRIIIPVVSIVIVGILVGFAHWPVLSAEAYSFDDHQYLSTNPLVQNPNWASARRFLVEVFRPSTVRGYYQPLTMISLMLDYAMGGRVENLKPFHLTSLCLHVVNTALVIVLLYLLFDRPLVAAMVGLLFGLHPMTVEPIPWIGERKTLLATFFALWCLISYVWYTRRRNWRRYGICLAMYVLALMSKPTSVPVPVLMLLLDFWPIRRLSRRTVLEKIPFFAIGGVFAVITFVSQKLTAVVVMPSEYNPMKIPLVLCHNIIFYLHKIIWPTNLSSHYPYPAPLNLSQPAVLIGVVGTCILIIILVISFRWTPVLLIGWLFFFIAILPTMQIIGFSDVIASDKFAYLPSVGLLLSLTWFLTRSWNGRRKLWQVGIRRVALVVIVMVLALLEGVATRRYLVHWQETESHWRYMISMAPHSHSLHSGLAYAFLQKGKVDEAIKECHEALRLKPTDSIAYHGLGIALTQKNELDQAIACYKEALKIGPDDARTHSDLAVALLQKGRVDGAIEECRHALRLKPDSFITHHRLGMALTQKNRVDQAIGHYNRALELNPDYAKAHCDLGFALLQKGQVKPAIKHFRESVRLEPNFHSGLNNLAWVLATHENPEVRNPVEAIQLAEQACEISHYKQPGNLDTLAAAYAAAGRFDEAVEIAEKAVELSSEDKTQADEIRSRLSLYRERKPYYELAQPIR